MLSICQKRPLPPSSGIVEFLNQLGMFLLCLMPLMLALGRATADIAATTLGCLFLLRMAARFKAQFFKQPDIAAAFFLWLGLVVLSVVMQGIASDSVIRVVLLGRFIFFYAAIRYWLTDDPQLREWLVITTLSTLLFILLDSFTQSLMGVSLTGHRILEERLTGPLSNANVGNLALKLLLPIGGYAILLARSKSAGWKIWIAAMLLGTVALIPISGERSITLLMCGAIAVIALLSVWKRPKLARKVVLGMSSLLLIGALVSIHPTVILRYHEFLQHIAGFWQSPYGMLFTTAYHLWISQPLTGVGVTHFYAACLAVNETAGAAILFCDTHGHNTYLHLLAVTGLIGLALMLIFIVTVMHRWWLAAMASTAKEAMPFAFLSAALFVILFPVIVTQNLFSNWPAALMWYTLGVSVALLCALCHKPVEEEEKS